MLTLQVVAFLGPTINKREHEAYKLHRKDLLLRFYLEMFSLTCYFIVTALSPAGRDVDVLMWLLTLEVDLR